MTTYLQFTVLAVLGSASATSALRSSVTCDPGMYYDFAIGRCDLCDSICDYAEIQGTVLECSTKCPDFRSSYKGDKSIDTVTTTTETASRSCGEERRTITMLLIALCGVSFLLILMMVVIIVLTFRRAGLNQNSYSVSRTTEPLLRRDGHAQCVAANGQILTQTVTAEPKSVASERDPVP
ncbi:uncharacterized protein [Haliotis cracherodii]|uniref:uncharacterized protein n=1 Tax=Haliotis cracherodii TaxID=6455 RepID=UPI0039E9B0D0